MIYPDHWARPLGVRKMISGLLRGDFHLWMKYPSSCLISVIRIFGQSLRIMILIWLSGVVVSA
ncbi:hypothetical protein BO70DRAFT_97321 [Aspergillus heteromorphus CBS 117.55]|uniref:Uncharacterized protein n=1 Tax=Aspergillus heteromorphus CBS 117.55 TaxID=1448321 RepID=A0A317VRD5_9EURO|nr:uncharacterized protein BO70DRAFT_97321 [Aspergillus heteromorphus CBS 117.55]PWY75452.1 hypothetical protein BO70DRAFT_97321 [Aspergillus heteromorphus CBS 117.55]